MPQLSSPSDLETAACLWEAVLALRDHPVSNPAGVELALQIRSAFKALGTSDLRMTVIGWVHAVDADWSKINDDYSLSFDWDFVPSWIIRHVDWSDPGHPVLKPDDKESDANSGGNGGEQAEDGCDEGVASDPEAPMTFPTTIHTDVSQSLLGKITRFFNGSILDVLIEAIQNGRRAGATRIDIDRIETDSGLMLRIRDDGRGIADPAKFLSLGDSGWDDDVVRSEDPAGMGVFCLAGRHVIVRSHAADLGAAWQATITPDAWENGSSLDLTPSSIDKGTEIEFDLPECWSKALDQAVREAALYCPVAVWFGGERQHHEDFLQEAIRVEEWNGCRIGIYPHNHDLFPEKPRINFHGLAIPCRLPHIQGVDDGRGWYAKVDICDAPGLHLVLPARKEIVQGAALDNLREACEAAIFRTIAREGYHRLSRAHWHRAGALGVILPEAAPYLFEWTPRTAESDDVYLGDRVAGEPMILMSTDHAHMEQCLARAIGSGLPLGARPVDPVDDFVGYSWYDDLPRVLGWSFRVEQDDGEMLDLNTGSVLPPALASGRVGAITLEIAIQASNGSDEPADILWLPADLVIFPPDYWLSLDECVILLSADCTVTPDDLVSLLACVCFNPTHSGEADSYDTQQTEFQMHARFIANTLLLGEDTAIIERIREAMRHHVSWLIPKDRAMTIRAVNYLVEASFAANDDTLVVDAAE